MIFGRYAEGEESASSGIFVSPRREWTQQLGFVLVVQVRGYGFRIRRRARWWAKHLGSGVRQWLFNWRRPTP